MEKVSNLLVESKKIFKEFYLRLFIFILALLFSACNNNDANTQQSSINVSQLQSEPKDSSKTVKPQNDLNIIDKNTNLDNNATINTINKPVDAKALYAKCVACHGVNGDKVAPGSEGDVLIANLSKDEIIRNLKGYRDRSIKKGKSSAIMYLQSADLSDNDIESLGEYISSFNK